MRPSCLFCARKHLAQAEVLMLEALKGYPAHAWLAVGHLAEAEDELLAEYAELSGVIRGHRLSYMAQIDSAGAHQYDVPTLELIAMVSAARAPSNVLPPSITSGGVEA